MRQNNGYIARVVQHFLTADGVFLTYVNGRGQKVSICVADGAVPLEALRTMVGTKIFNRMWSAPRPDSVPLTAVSQKLASYVIAKPRHLPRVLKDAVVSPFHSIAFVIESQRGDLTLLLGGAENQLDLEILVTSTGNPDRIQTCSHRRCKVHSGGPWSSGAVGRQAYLAGTFSLEGCPQSLRHLGLAGHVQLHDLVLAAPWAHNVLVLHGGWRLGRR